MIPTTAVVPVSEFVWPLLFKLSGMDSHVPQARLESIVVLNTFHTVHYYLILQK